MSNRPVEQHFFPSLPLLHGFHLHGSFWHGPPPLPPPPPAPPPSRSADQVLYMCNGLLPSITHPLQHVLHQDYNSGGLTIKP